MKPPTNVTVRITKRAVCLSVCISELKIRALESQYVAGAISSCQTDYNTKIYVWSGLSAVFTTNKKTRCKILASSHVASQNVDNR
jgi:hypothetical protein